MSTPIQYNQEVNQALSNQNSENTSSLGRTKPKKLSMSAKSKPSNYFVVEMV
jgi:hypothetical protein